MDAMIDSVGVAAVGVGLVGARGEFCAAHRVVGPTGRVHVACHHRVVTNDHEYREEGACPPESSLPSRV